MRFCGKRFDASGHDYLLDVEDNTRKTTHIEIAKHRTPGDPVTKGEEKQLKSVVGSLSWIARQARPVFFQVSKLQSSIKGATVSTLKEAKKVLELALNGMDLKLRYKNGPFNFRERGVLTASDASFAGEPGRKSRQGRIHFLVPAHQLLDPKCCDYDVMIRGNRAGLARRQQKSNPARDALRLPEPCSQLEHRSAVKGSRQKAANRARRHTPIDIRWRRQAYGRGLPKRRRPC